MRNLTKIDVMVNAVILLSVILLLIGLKYLYLVEFLSPLHWRSLCTVNILEGFLWAVLFWRRYHDRYSLFLLALIPGANIFYTNVPIGLYIAGLDIFPFATKLVWKSFVLQSLMSSHLWAFMYLLFSREHALMLANRCKNWSLSLNASRFGLSVVSLLGLLISSVYLANFYTSGASALIGTTARAELSRSLETGKVWLMNYLFCTWLITYAVLLLSPVSRKAFRWHHIVISAIATSAFMFAYISVGNRRELMIAAIFIAVIIFLRGHGRFVLISGLSVVPLLLFKGVTRSLNGLAVSSVDQITFYLNLLGEFVFPHFPLIYQMEKGRDLLLGSTYFNLPGYILPSFGLWEKTFSLSIVFSNEYANKLMGFGYTPLAEGFQNFGVCSIVLVPALITLILYCATRLRSGFPIPILVAFSFALDINRGEFVTITFQGIIFSLGILFFLAMSRLELRIKPICDLH